MKRYSTWPQWVQEDEAGEWVRYKDVAELTAERDRLQRINVLYEKNFKDPAGHRCGCIFDSNDDVVTCCDYHASWRKERDRLRAAVKELIEFKSLGGYTADYMRQQLAALLAASQEEK